jgi:hypothetical protein
MSFSQNSHIRETGQEACIRGLFDFQNNKEGEVATRR